MEKKAANINAIMGWVSTFKAAKLDMNNIWR